MADIVFSTLVDVDKDEVTILPDLAQNGRSRRTRPSYTFHLNPAAVWSDGKPVTADDVEWTIAWAAQNPDACKRDPDPDVATTSRAAMRSRGPTNIPEGIKKIDANTVEITLKAPDSTFLRRIAGAVYYIQPKHILDGLTGRAGGELRVLPRHRRRDDRLRPVRLLGVDLRHVARRFKAKKNYWKGKDSQIDNLVYKIQESNVSVAQLAAGELDLIDPRPTGRRARASPTCRASSSSTCPGVGIFNINFNNTNTDKALRQAIAYAINRPEAIEKVLGGLATLNYTIPPGFKVYDDINKYEFDLDKGKAAPGHLQVGQEQDLPAGAAGRGSELHRHRSGAPAVHRGPGPQGRADRAADRAVHGPDPEDQ